MGENILVTVSKIMVGDQKHIASSVWKLGKLNDDYLDLCESWVSGSGKNTVEDALKFGKEYFGLLLGDPFLPKELLPKPWFGDKANQLYLAQARKILAYQHSN